MDSKNKHVVLVKYTLNKLQQINANLKNAPIFNKIAADLGYTAETSVSNATPAKVAIAA